MPATQSPALVVRTYLDEHDGWTEVPLHNLLTTWSVEDSDREQRARIEHDLARVGIAVDPYTADLDVDDEVTLLLAGLAAPAKGSSAPGRLAHAA